MISLDKKIEFGTGGWRAKIGEDFSKQNVLQVTRAIATVYLVNKYDTPIAIGYDNRFLSEEARDWIAQGLNDLGIAVVTEKHSIPTPQLMSYVKRHNLDFGIMVTASHNPYIYNGIKVIVKGGVDASVEMTNEIQSYIDNYCFVSARQRTNFVTTFYGLEEDLYKEELYSAINVNVIKNHPLNVQFNGMNGSASTLFGKILNELHTSGLVYQMHTLRDTLFESCGGVPEPNIEHCADFIEEYKMCCVQHGIKYLGLIFDGDGDRLMVLDEKGEAVDMNILLPLLYKYLHEVKGLKGGVVRNVVTSTLLDKLAKKYREDCIEVPVGFKWITQAMKSSDALIGGESSGGLAIRGHITGKDSILASLLVLEMLASTGKSLRQLINELYEDVGEVHFESTKFTYDASLKDKLQEFICKYEDENAISKETMDGTKFIYDDGSWVSLRFSGTEPVIRIMVQGNSSVDALKLRKDIERKLVKSVQPRV